MKYVITSVNQITHVLRSVRTGKSLRQKDVGELTGMLPKTVSALENHPGTVTLESLFKLIAALDLELILADKEQCDTDMEEG